MANLNDILENYKNYLRVKHDLRFKLFERLEKKDPQAARAEAVVFSFLRSQGLDPHIEEDPSTGGVDFICGTGSGAFYVEVTSVEREAAATRSGIPNEIEEQKAFWFDFITQSLWNKVYRKSRQFAAITRPALLVITGEHVASEVFFGEIGAQTLLVGDVQIRVSVGQPGLEETLSTQYNNSAFINKRGEIHEPSQRISGILLIGINQNYYSMVGILNPDPKHAFPIGNLPSVSFLRLDVWPPKDGIFRTQWVIGNPDIPRIDYSVFALTEQEYRELE